MSEDKIAKQVKRRLISNRKLIDVVIIASDNGFDRIVDTMNQIGLNYEQRELHRTVKARLVANDIVYLSSQDCIAKISENYEGEQK